MSLGLKCTDQNSLCCSTRAGAICLPRKWWWELSLNWRLLVNGRKKKIAPLNQTGLSLNHQVLYKCSQKQQTNILRLTKHPLLNATLILFPL